MMRHLRFGLSLLLLVALAAGLLLLARGRTPEWTTPSDEARKELELAIDAQMKHYWGESREHLERALELDPDFVAARLLLLEGFVDGERREELVAELREADPEPLNARERFLLGIRLAEEAGDAEEADRLIDDYLEGHPEDPWALATCSAQAWLEQDWKRAEDHYRKLLEADPNWVDARNRLGYIAMAQGRFTEAEEQFRAYRYLAPDQPNPHDSMGELLTLLGRYDEARAELGRAIEIRPDFCHAYTGLLEIEILRGLPDGAEQIIELAAPHCSDDYLARLRCVAVLWQDFFDHDFDAPWREERADCLERVGREDSRVHRMAALTGRFAEARAIEERLREKLDTGSRHPIEERVRRAVLLHMTGVRLIAEGEYEMAARYLEKADGLLVYFGEGIGILKLYNRMQQAYALERMGREAESRAIVDKVAKVNADFAEIYPWIRETFERARPAAAPAAG